MKKDSLKARWIESETAFLGLKNEWDRLTGSLNASFFLQHTWFRAAWQWQKCVGELKVLTILEHDQIIAICPFAVQPAFYHHLQVKELAFITVPDSQSCDWLVPPDKFDNIRSFVFQALKNAPFHWDVLNWRLLNASSLLVHMDFHHEALPFNLKLQDGGIHPCIKLKPNWAGYYQEKSRRLKKGNNAIVNKLNREGSLELKRMLPHRETKDEILSVIINLSSKSWKTQTETALNFKGPQQFVEALFEYFSETRQLLIWLLSLDGKPIAYELDLLSYTDYYALRSDYDPNYQHLSPGTYLNWKVIQALFEEKGTCYYMGPGSNAYKLRWQNDEIKLHTLRGYNQTLKGQLILWLDRNIAPVLRPVKHRIIKLIRG